MKVVLLCGGRGTRAYPYTEHIPKPMIPVNGSPILLHVMSVYARQGYNDFVLSVGYRNEVIRDYFYRKSLDWRIEVVDTGLESDTAERIRGCEHVLEDTFFATYADGLCDVSLPALLDFHRSHDGVATLTTVPLRSHYGTVEFDGDGRVDRFREKPVLRTHWINAGFFVFDHAALDEWRGANLEQEVFPDLARRGLLFAYRHDGVFRSMDNIKDQQDMEEFILRGEWSCTEPVISNHPGDTELLSGEASASS